MTKKVVTLGEIMLRLSTPGHQRFVQADRFIVHYGGAEANVAVALSNYGIQGTFVSKIPENPIGQSTINQLRKYGVDTKLIARGGKRVGVYFLESGASMRASKVLYDRAGSAFAEARVEDFDFDEIFKDAIWFHTTGITPALSKNAAKITKVALQKAKEKGITTSLDLNYKKQLWTKEEARQVIPELCPYIDVCITNEEDTEASLGFKSKQTNLAKGKPNMGGYKEVLPQIQEKFDFKYIACTLRESYSASDNGWSALFYDGKEYYHSKKYNIRIIDQMGGRDSFASGLIYALIEGMETQKAIEFATAASALKQTFPGDFNHATLEEINRLITGDTSGRVQR